VIGRGFCALLLAGWLAVGSAAAGEYDFDIPEAEPSPREIGGRLEGRYLYRRRNADSIRAPSRAEGAGSDRHEWRTVAELSARWRTRRFQAGLLTHHQFVHADDDDRWDHEIYEARASWTPSPRLTVDAGKKRVLWGKGYAWNPVGFLNRPKDPDDPDLNLEGRVLLGFDLIRSFPEGDLSNLAVTALLLPVADDWANEDLGGAGDWNAAVKLYLLWRDTDIDLVFFDGPEQPFSLGVDFAKNLAENFEVHGELAFRNDVLRRTADGDRRVREDRIDGLLGLRWLNAWETTFIAEYYRNGAGYDGAELETFFAASEFPLPAGETAGDQRRDLGKDYFYLKISQKEPFGILDFTPWIASAVNLRDFSFSVRPGMTWAPLSDLELNLRAAIPVGPPRTEFGETPDAFRAEFWARYYF
jgi:hypothetical protein